MNFLLTAFLRYKKIEEKVPREREPGMDFLTEEKSVLA